jgi:hypothetical protein
MSAPLIVSIPHRLGREEATRRLKAGLTRAAASIPASGDTASPVMVKTPPRAGSFVC